MVGIPIYKGFEQDDYAAGMVSMLLTSATWDVFFTNILNNNVKSIDLFIEEDGACGDAASSSTVFEYAIEGPKCIYKGVKSRQSINDHPQAKFGVSHELKTATSALLLHQQAMLY